MKKVVIVSKKNLDSIKKSLGKMGFKYDSKKPDIVLSVGGDGTLLYAERLYPGIPKVLIRDLKGLNYRKISKYKFKKYQKIDAYLNGKKRLTGTNDITIRNKNQTCAIRFNLYINNRKISNVIGDGIVISTVFGSTGYFRTIAKRSFKRGIGLALNNTSFKKRYFLLKDNSKIKLELLREQALLSTDNNPKIFTLKKGDKVIIKRSNDYALVRK